MCEEGKFSKGGVNEKPTTPRPPAPKRQGSSNDFMNRKHEKPYIICAALWIDDGIARSDAEPKNIASGFVVAGRRHHNCFFTAANLYGKPVREMCFPANPVQGFLTSDDRFVDRIEAARIAEDCGQIVVDSTNCLFSEDIY